MAAQGQWKEDDRKYLKTNVDGTERMSCSYGMAKRTLEGVELPDGMKVDLWPTDGMAEEPCRIGICRGKKSPWTVYMTDAKGRVASRKGCRTRRAATWHVVQMALALAGAQVG